MATFPTFNGPARPLELAHWLRRCEDYFEDDAGGNLKDKQKIHAAGRALSTAEASKGLYDWFTENQDELEGRSWSDFKYRLKDEAFGKGWRTRALQEFHTTTHDGQTVDQYLKALQQKKFVIDQNDTFIADETWKTAQEFFYKCHMLFHAPPAVTDLVLKEKLFSNEEELHAKGPAEVQQWLRDYSDKAPPPSPTPSQLASSGMYMLSGLTPMGFPSADWCDVTRMPQSSHVVTRTKSLSILWTDYFLSSQIPSLKAYTFETGDPSSSHSRVFNSRSDSSENYTTIDLEPGEYISSVMGSYKNYELEWIQGQISTKSVLVGIEIRSSNPKKMISKGNLSGRLVTLTAPLGWRIVGFYGFYYEHFFNNRTEPGNIINNMGAIYLPV